MEMKDSMELEKWSILQTIPTLKVDPQKIVEKRLLYRRITVSNVISCIVVVLYPQKSHFESFLVLFLVAKVEEKLLQKSR